MKKISSGFYGETRNTTANGDITSVDVQLYKTEGSDSYWVFTITETCIDDDHYPSKYYQGEDVFQTKRSALESLELLLKAGFTLVRECGWCGNKIVI